MCTCTHIRLITKRYDTIKLHTNMYIVYNVYTCHLPCNSGSGKGGGIMKGGNPKGGGIKGGTKEEGGTLVPAG